MLICDCPKSAAIPDITVDECKDNVGQVQKAILQRINSTGTTKNTIADPTLLASWTPLLAAADGTKVVQTPYLYAPATEPGAAITYGGGNETLGGVEEILGAEATAFTANILRKKQYIIKELKKYMCENVGVWLVNENGKIWAIADDPETPTTYYPIPISALFVGDKSIGGRENPDINIIQWKFFENWSDDLVEITPADFNALTDLATPTS